MGSFLLSYKNMRLRKHNTVRRTAQAVSPKLRKKGHWKQFHRVYPKQIKQDAVKNQTAPKEKTTLTQKIPGKRIREAKFRPTKEPGQHLQRWKEMKTCQSFKEVFPMAF